VTLVIDAEALHRKYREESDKRLRADSIDQHIFHSEVTGLEWDDAQVIWVITTMRGPKSGAGGDCGAGAGTRTPDHRFKSSSRTPQDGSSCLLLYSILRISPPRGTSWHPGLAIQIGYTSEGPLAIARRARTPNGKGPSQPRSVGRLPWRS
jgi:hypothetical protein